MSTLAEISKKLQGQTEETKSVKEILEDILEQDHKHFEESEKSAKEKERKNKQEESRKAKREAEDKKERPKGLAEGLLAGTGVQDVGESLEKGIGSLLRGMALAGGALGLLLGKTLRVGGIAALWTVFGDKLISSAIDFLEDMSPIPLEFNDEQQDEISSKLSGSVMAWILAGFVSKNPYLRIGAGLGAYFREELEKLLGIELSAPEAATIGATGGLATAVGVRAAYRTYGNSRGQALEQARQLQLEEERFRRVSNYQRANAANNLNRAPTVGFNPPKQPNTPNTTPDKKPGFAGTAGGDRPAWRPTVVVNSGLVPDGLPTIATSPDAPPRPRPSSRAASGLVRALRLALGLPLETALFAITPTMMGTDPQEQLNSNINNLIESGGISALPEVLNILESYAKNAPEVLEMSGVKGLLDMSAEELKEYVRANYRRVQDNRLFYSDTNAVISQLMRDYTKEGDFQITPDELRRKLERARKETLDLSLGNGSGAGVTVINNNTTNNSSSSSAALLGDSQASPDYYEMVGRPY